MSSYTAITEDGKYLIHYGVKGMKWGKRRKYSGSKTSTESGPRSGTNKKSKGIVYNTSTFGRVEKEPWKYTAPDSRASLTTPSMMSKKADKLAEEKKKKKKKTKKSQTHARSRIAKPTTSGTVRSR